MRVRLWGGQTVTDRNDLDGQLFGVFSLSQYLERYQVGYAQNLRDALPNATFVAFTGTPVSNEHGWESRVAVRPANTTCSLNWKNGCS